MSNTFSLFAKQPVELAPSRWPRLIWGLGVALVVIALLLSGLSLMERLLAGFLLLLAGLLEWRQRPRLCSLQFSSQAVTCTLGNGERLEACWPLVGMANRYWISFALPASRAWPIWLTVYRDQLCADDFRRLGIMMRR